MATLALRDLSGLSPDYLAALAGEVGGLQTLADVVAWAARHTPPAAITDVVTQDEFTHDVVVALAGGRALVFDAT